MERMKDFCTVGSELCPPKEPVINYGEGDTKMGK